MKTLIITCLIFSAFCFFLLWLFKNKVVKGMAGEMFVGFCLKKLLDKDQYQVISDILIPDRNGGTTQIDHIVFSKFGIFVVETKNWGGKIYGEANSEYWKQYFFGNKPNKFSNPIKQNIKHIKCLAEVTGAPEKCFINTIIFCGSTLKNRDRIPASVVPGVTSLINYIKSYCEELMTAEELAAAVDAIEKHRLKNSLHNRRAHTEYVKNNIIANKKSAGKRAPERVPAAVNIQETAVAVEVAEEPERPDPPRLCPICGSLMVERVSGKGKNQGKLFWGCSKYPCPGRRFK